MGYHCEMTGKVTTFGRNIRHKHSGRWKRKAPRTSRTFKPNVHNQTIIVNGKQKRVDVSTAYLRTMMKHIAEGKAV